MFAAGLYKANDMGLTKALAAWKEVQERLKLNE